MTPAAVTGYLRDLHRTISDIEDAIAAGDLSEHEVEAAWSGLTHAVYRRIRVEGASLAGIELTPAAYQHGLTLALPEEVGVCYGGPDRIRTGDLQRDRLACLATTPRARGGDGGGA